MIRHHSIKEGAELEDHAKALAEEEAHKAETEPHVRLLLCYAAGLDGEQAIQIASEVDPKIPAGKLRLASSRVLAWHRFFLDIFRSGQIHKGLPEATTLANTYFNGNMDEAGLVAQLFPMWVESALPKTELEPLLKALWSVLEDNQPRENIDQILGQLPEPKRTVANAIWNSPERVALRARSDSPVQRFLRNEAKGAARLSAGQGCAGNLSTLITLFVGAMILIGVVSGLAKGCH